MPTTINELKQRHVEESMSKFLCNDVRDCESYRKSLLIAARAGLQATEPGVHLLSTGPCEISLFHITVVVITDDYNLFWGTYSESAAWLHLFLPPPMCNLESRPFKSMWSRQTLSRPWEVFGRKKIISECPRSESAPELAFQLITTLQAVNYILKEIPATNL